VTVRLDVELGERSYPVHVGAGLLANVGGLVREAVGTKARKAALILDANVPTEAFVHVSDSLGASNFDVFIVQPPRGERCKRLDWLKDALVKLTWSRHERGDVVVTLGGGAVCDLGGFVASIYRRGVPVVHCPTTLLAMVDASVGGKTGVNLVVDGALKKNMIGAFWQPRAVVADVEVLRSLPERELRAGVGECLKHGLLGGHAGMPELFDWTVERLGDIAACKPDVLEQLIAKNVHVKKTIVGSDEREEADDADGGRALLNLGHTFGHVIEAETELLHGEAVALGLIAASVASEDLGLVSGLSDRVRGAVEAAGLPTSTSLPELLDLIRPMLDDKKVVGGEMRIIVPVAGYRAQVVRQPLGAVRQAWEAIRKTTQA
jgi:3-dehydroquinate synthetase